jgi:hypothetical protein
VTASLDSGTINGNFSDLNKAVNDVSNKFKDLSQKVHDRLGSVQRLLEAATVGAAIFVPDEVVLVAGVAMTEHAFEDMVRQCEGLLHSINKILQQLEHYAQEAIDHQLPIISLYHLSQQWTDRMLPVVSKLKGDIKGIDVYPWQGHAKDLYDARTSDQLDAVTRVTSDVQTASDWLLSVAGTELKYVELIITTAGQIGSTIAIAAVEAAEAELVVTIPAALEKCDSLVGTGIQLLASLSNNYLDVKNDAENEKNKIGQVMKNQLGYVDGAWPPTHR